MGGRGALALRIVVAAAAMTAPVPVSAKAGFALFAETWQAPSTEQPAARQIIARATAALERTPGAIPRLHTEGTLPGHGIRDASIAAKQDQLIVFDLAMAWRLTGDRRFLRAAIRYLDDWTAIYRPSLNPIDETGFDTMMLATDLVAPELTPARRARFTAFWRGMAAGYLDAMDAGAPNPTTNWQSHRVKLATLGAFMSGDAALIDRARKAFRRQVSANILADGSVEDFRLRDALHYVVYDLDPLLMASLAAARHGEEWFSWQSPSGSSLPRALGWLEPYATGARQHMDFARTTNAFDRARAAAGDATYAPHLWKPGASVRTYALASLCDPSYAPLLARIVRNSGKRPSAWMTLLLGEQQRR